MTRPRKSSPRAMATAYRAWDWCETHGWEHTLAEIADALDVHPDHLRGVMQSRGWLNRVRKVAPADYETAAPTRPVGMMSDGLIDDLQRWA